MAKFEKVSRFADVDLAMPVRKTANSAGYDLVVAQDIVIPSYKNLIGKIKLGNSADKCANPGNHLVGVVNICNKAISVVINFFNTSASFFTL